jgi:hypothetical protein
LNWKFKAIIQILVDKLPPGLSYSLYYYIQRKFGELQKTNPLNDLNRSIEIVEMIRKSNYTINDKVLLEIGTGRTLNIPIGLWLCGARKIITIDINPYLKKELVLESINWVKYNEYKVRKLFNNIANQTQFNNRLRQLISVKPNLNQILKLCNIDYLSPANACSLNLKDKTIDCQFSTDVFEHIPLSILKSIFIETKRILADDGLLVHMIDLSDHFTHFDNSITSINFLQFSEKQWKQWAGNKFMYHNRLRASEFYKLFNEIGMQIVMKEEYIDQRALEIINRGFPLDNRFAGRPPRDLAISRLDVVGMFS